MKLINQEDYNQGKIDRLKGRKPDSSEYPTTESYMKGYNEAKEKTVRLHIPDLPRNLHAEAKMCAIRVGLSLKDWVKVAIRETIKNQNAGSIIETDRDPTAYEIAMSCPACQKHYVVDQFVKIPRCKDCDKTLIFEK